MPRHVTSRGLLDHALATVIASADLRTGGDETRRDARGLVVIVSPTGTTASHCLDEFRRRHGPGLVVPDDAAIWDGAALGRAMAAATRRDAPLGSLLSEYPLVVVDDLDRLGSRNRQSLFASLLDSSLARGTAFCVSLRQHPGSANVLEPRLASRLCAGLVVTISSTSQAADAGRCGTSLRRVLRIAAAHHELEIDDLIGPSRRREVAAARSLAMYLARIVTRRSLYAIGAACGDRDHSTVIHAIRVVERRIASDAAFSADVSRLAARLRGAPRACGRRQRRAGVGPPSIRTTSGRSR